MELIRRVQKLLPVLTWLPNMTWADMLADVVAGVTVALTMIPQVIAYAGLAGLSPEYGLFSGLVGGIVYFFLGSTSELCIGPTALMALFTYTYTHDTDIQMVVTLTFLCGVVEVLCGLLRFGALVQFVSIPVVSGFTSAAALIIASSQVKNLFGLSYNSGDFISSWVLFFENFYCCHWTDIVIGFICMACLLLLKLIGVMNMSCYEQPSMSSSSRCSRIFWFIITGRNAIIVFFWIGFSYYGGLNPSAFSQSVEAGLPGVINPLPLSNLLDIVSHLGSGLLIIPLLAIISNIAIVKAFANGKAIDANREMITLGLCNMVGAFFCSMPIAGSFTRAAVLSASGVKSPLRGIVTSIVVMMALVFLTPLIQYIPRATLSAVVICSVISMVDVKIVKEIWHSNRRDLIPLTSTFLASLILGVEIGFGIGLIVDLCIFLHFTARPQVIIRKLRLLGTGINENLEVLHWRVVPVEHVLFPSIDHMRAQIVAAVRDDPERAEIRVPGVVLDFALVSRIDFTAAQGLRALVEDLKAFNMLLVLIHPRPAILKNVLGCCRGEIFIARNESRVFDILARALIFDEYEIVNGEITLRTISTQE